MTIRQTRRKFTIEEYHRMAEAGILHEDDRVELIEGEIVEMSPIGSRHAACVNRLNALMGRQVAGVAILSIQNPLLLPGDSEPEPAVMILRPREDFYAETHPTPEDVLLLIEVSETSLEYDREVKLPLYARSGVPEVWVVNLSGEEILTYSRPEGEVYAEFARVERGGSLASHTVPDLTLNVEDVLS
jgi:Uma2 family endonuclease